MIQKIASEQHMKQVLQAYIDLYNRADAEGIADLYAEDATVEDPVGSPVKHGKAEIAAFYRMAVQSKAHLTLAAPIRGSGAGEAAMAFDVELDMPTGRSVIRVIDTMRFNVDGRVAAMRAYWGPGDLVLVPAS